MLRLCLLFLKISDIFIIAVLVLFLSTNSIVSVIF